MTFFKRQRHIHFQIKNAKYQFIPVIKDHKDLTFWAGISLARQKPMGVFLAVEIIAFSLTDMQTEALVIHTTEPTFILKNTFI